MEGLLLIAVYAAIASAGEAVAIGIGFLLDQINPATSMIIFMLISAVVLGFAWPVAIRLTESREN